MKKVSSPKVYLYLLLILLVAASLLFLWMSNHSSLSENFLTSAIEILITVLVIDGLLSLNRRKRLDQINAGHADSTRIQCGFVIIRILTLFDYQVHPSELDAVQFSNNDIRGVVNNFVQSRQYLTFLKRLRNAEKATFPIVHKLQETLEDSISILSKSIKQAEPYPDPLLIRLISDVQPSLIASFKMIDFLYESVNTKLPEIGAKYPGTPDEVMKQIRSFFSQSMKELVEEGDGAHDRANFNTSFRKLLEALLIIHEKAQSNKLYYDI